MPMGSSLGSCSNWNGLISALTRFFFLVATQSCLNKTLLISLSLSHGFEYAERAEDPSHVCER